VDARLKVSGAGDSIDALMQNAAGRMSMVIDGGRISNFALEALGLDLWEMLRLKAAGDKSIPVRCGVLDFAINRGVMQAKTAVLDTEDTNVTLAGDIDLGRESLDLTLHATPKDPSPLALRQPIHIRGRLTQPDIKLEKRRIAAKAAGALALGLVNPLLAILPLVETGPGRDSNCGKLIAEAEENGVPRSGQRTK
jgi:AsmA protein